MDNTQPVLHMNNTLAPDILYPSDSISQAAYKTDLSIQHIKSAALYARLCAQVENKHNPYIPNSLPSEEFEDLLTEHRAHAISSIFFAAAFLESTLNSFFENSNLPERNSIYQNYNIVLSSNGKMTFRKKNFPRCRDIELLIFLRNALIHYKPEWITIIRHDKIVEKADVKKINKDRLEELRNLNILPSPFFAATINPFFPDKCLSHGYAKWAVESSLEFVEEFIKRMGLQYSFDDIRSRLKTEP